MQDAMTHGQSRLVRGQPTPAPNLKAHGCVLLPPGTPMVSEGGNAVPVVTAKLQNGTLVRGVTLPAMIAHDQQHLGGSMRPQPQPTPSDEPASRAAWDSYVKQMDAAPNPQLDAGLANSLSEELQHTLNAAKINVTAENGHVTLAGTVDTTADREEAARIAEARPNVRILTNSLIVQAVARPTADIPATVVDSGHESTVDRSDAKSSKELNAAGLRLLSARQSDFSEAKRTFEKAVQLDSTNIEALNNLGYVYSRIGDYRAAEAALLKVLAVAPTRRVAHGNLGYVEAKLGKTQEAVNHYCQYVRQFDSLERGKSALVHANAADPDPNVQAAIEATVANCTR